MIKAALLNSSIIFNEFSLSLFEGGEVYVNYPIICKWYQFSFFCTSSSIGWEPSITLEQYSDGWPMCLISDFKGNALET